MGALVSSSNRTPGSTGGSLKFGSGRRKRWEKSRRASSSHSKRSSINRPVLQLQVKPDTLECIRRRTGSVGIHVVPKDALCSIARDSGIYDTLLPQETFGATSVRTSNHTHHSRQYSTESQTSMVLLQIVEHDQHLVIEEKDENDYDHLLPRGDFSHLCACTYGRMEDHEGLAGYSEGNKCVVSSIGNHTANMIYGRGRSGSVLMSTGMSAEELKDRIRYHQPQPLDRIWEGNGREGSFRRSKSTTAINTNHIISNHEPPMKRPFQSTSQLCEDDPSDWTLGESIIRTLSKRDLFNFDIDNPRHQSEHEILEAWPKLKEKLKKWRRKSNQSVDDSTKQCDVFSNSEDPTTR